MMEYFYPLLDKSKHYACNVSDKYIVLLLKKSIAIMIKGKIRNKRVRKSFLEGKKKLVLFGRKIYCDSFWKAKRFRFSLFEQAISRATFKEGAFFLGCETMERAQAPPKGLHC